MKKFIYILSVVASLGLTNCDSDTFLEEPRPTDKVSEVDIFGSKEGVDAYLAGVYRSFRGQYTRTDAGGVYSVLFARTIKGTDLIQRPTWFRWDYQHENREPTYTRTRFNWEFFYDMIDHANTMIKGIEASTAISAVDKADLIAHAKLLRGYSYFQLASDYQHAYQVDPTAPGLPIYTEPTLEPKGMSTLQEVYDLVLSDVNAAVADLSEDRIDKSYMNKAVAHAIKVKVLMAMDKDWGQVEASAIAAYGGDIAAVLAPETYGDGFDDISNKEWLWGMYQTGDQTNYYYAAPHVFTDHKHPSYSATYVDKNFVALFTETDVRNTFENFYDHTDYREFITNKFTFKFESDMPLIRTPEMILAEAEAKYHQGKESEAHAVLFALQSNRDSKFEKSSNTGNDLFEEILVERRKELYGETGVEWFDARRLQRGLERGSHHRTDVDLEPNDKKFVLKIPKVETDANPNIDSSINDNR